MSNVAPAPGGGRGSRRPDAIPASSDRRFREAVRRLHQCGPRPTGELLGEIAAGVCLPCRALVLGRVDRYGELDPDLVRWAGGADWLDDVELVRLIGGRS